MSAPGFAQRLPQVAKSVSLVLTPDRDHVTVRTDPYTGEILEINSAHNQKIFTPAPSGTLNTRAKYLLVYIQQTPRPICRKKL